MKILVVSNIYPPITVGGYEIECAAVSEHLARSHEVLVLTGVPRRGGAYIADREETQGAIQLRRDLPRLRPNARGAWSAPRASLRAVSTARDALAWRPDLVYVWNGTAIPHAALRVIADSGVPLAFRIGEHWFANIFVGDQFLRELLPIHRGPVRAIWASYCRALNALPALRLDPTARVRTAISWNSEATKRTAQPPPFVEIVLERVSHPVPPHRDVYAAVERDPAPEPQIAFLGRVTPTKGVAVAIEALALLRTEHAIPANLMVAGPEDGDHGNELRALADRLGVGSAVHWNGQATPEQAAAMLARAHALIVPSTWDEPFGLVMIEGALARVPLVASDVGGISEGMHDEEHALFFARDDVAGAATALARSIREAGQTAARVKRAYARAQEFRLTSYLRDQEAFVSDAHLALDERIAHS